MRDKRDVMRLHIKNGIRDLDGIRGSYNAFADGGDSNVIPYGKKLKTYKPIDKSNYNPEQEYINNWLRERKSTGNYENQLGGLEYNRQITNLSHSKEIPEFDFYKNLMRDNNAPEEKIPDMVANEMVYNIQNRINWVYNINSNELWANKNAGSTNLLHEHAHSLNATPQENLIKTQIQISDPYWDDPSEIYSRLMEFRKKNNINPKKNYSLEEINEFKSKADKDQLFDRYTPKQLHFLLNRVAQNNQQLPSNFLNNDIT